MSTDEKLKETYNLDPQSFPVEGVKRGTRAEIGTLFIDGHKAQANVDGGKFERMVFFSELPGEIEVALVKSPLFYVDEEPYQIKSLRLAEPHEDDSEEYLRGLCKKFADNIRKLKPKTLFLYGFQKASAVVETGDPKDPLMETVDPNSFQAKSVHGKVKHLYMVRFAVKL